MGSARRIAGLVALVCYLVMGAMLYLTVLPSSGGLRPPDFHLLGYNASTIAPFVTTLTDEGRATYGATLRGWDRAFIVALALWLSLSGWRSGWLRYVVAGLAVVYAVIDLAENAAIHAFVVASPMDAGAIAVAHSLTMAKFASL